jgi:hypothetical protein
VDQHEKRIEELEQELTEAKRRLAGQRQRVYGGKRPFDPIRAAELERNVEGAAARLARERG